MIEKNFDKKIFELEPKPKKIFVEIGVGGSAIPALGGKRKFEGDEYYFGIDVREEDLKISKDLARDVYKLELGKNIHFLEADARNLPFEDKSVDEIFFGNIFGYRRIPLADKKKFLEEARRVLKDENGILIVKETLTPIGFNDLENLLKEYHFQLQKKIGCRDKEWEEELEKYEAKKFSLGGGITSYIAYFLKEKV